MPSGSHGDQLSGRQFLLDRMRASLAHWARYGGMVAVVAVDLDRFARINEAWGYEAGDRLLAALSARMRERFRAADAVARLEGDKFGFLFDGPQPATDHAIVAIAERVRAVIEEPVLLDEREVFVTGSMGLALARPDIEAETLLSDAESAAGMAKRGGGARWEAFDPLVRGRALAQLEIEQQLHQALEAEEFRLHYQPIIELRSGLVTGVEALIRWVRPGVGLTFPADFVPVAEESGLILRIGRWVLHEVARQAVAHPVLRGLDGPPLTIAVNLSPRQVAWPGLPAQVAELLNQAGANPGQLCFELTESAIVTDASQAAAILGDIRAVGCALAIDDFGTGYSSLHHLKEFPLDALKIDRSFVTGVADSDSDRTISEVIISLAHALGLEAVAEGVETDEQLALLRSMGCDRAQGYRFARPMVLEELASWMDAHPGRW